MTIELTPQQLAPLPYRDFVTEMRLAMRDDERWKVFLEPQIIERTRDALDRLIRSIDKQLNEKRGTVDNAWVHRTKSLRRSAQSRLNSMPVHDGPIVSGSGEAKAWRRFARMLAVALRDQDWDALDRLKAPYGGLTAAEWVRASHEEPVQ